MCLKNSSKKRIGNDGGQAWLRSRAAGMSCSCGRQEHTHEQVVGVQFNTISFEAMDGWC